MTESSASPTFYPLTVATLDQLYQADLSPSELRLWLYLSALDPWGDRYEGLPDPLELMEKVGIKKSTFYAAIAKFQELNLFDFQVRGITYRNLMGAPKVWKGFQTSGKVSKNLEKFPNSWKEFQNSGRNSSDSENQTLEPLQSKGLESPHTNHTNQTNSHSQEQDESAKNDFQNELKKQQTANEATKNSSENGCALKKHDPFFNRKPAPNDIDWNWLPDGPWKTEQGKLDAQFQNAIAQRWVKEHGGDIHSKKANVLKHFRNEPTNLPIEWEWYQNLTLHKASNIQIRKDAGIDTTAEEQEIIKHFSAGKELPEELRVSEVREPNEVLEEVAPHTLKAIEAPSDEFGQINPDSYQLKESSADDRAFWQKIYSPQLNQATQSTNSSAKKEAEEAMDSVDDQKKVAKELIENLRRRHEEKRKRPLENQGEGDKNLASISKVINPPAEIPFSVILEDMRKYLNCGSDIYRQRAIDWACNPENGCKLVRSRSGWIVDIEEIDF